MSALMGGLQSSDIVTTSRPATTTPVSTHRANEQHVQDGKFDDVTELVIKSPRRRAPKPAAASVALVPAALVNPPTYPVWFESERDLGICRINWEGGTMTANLHASARLPE